MHGEILKDYPVIASDGQIKLSDDMRRILGVNDGGRVILIADGQGIRIVNPAIYAMQEAQKTMAGAAEEAGIYTEDDVVALVKEVRAELWNEKNIS